RNYNPRQGYQLTAPLSHTSGSTVYVFDRWVLNGAPQTLNQRVLNVDDIGVAADTAVAEFKIRRTLQVRSSNPASGISITVGTPDINNNQNGTTPFDRLYKDGTTVSLVAPAMNGIHPFKQWVLDGVNQPLGQTTINVSINGTRTATAIYYTHVNGSFTAFCSGCPGTGNQVPVHSGSGIPEIGNVVTWRVTNARPLSGGTLYLGASRTFFNGIPLPLNLGFLGMGASCRLCVSVDVSLAFATNSSGTATVNVPIPNNVALIQGSLFTQPAVVDIGAGTTVPIVHGNALETRLGGNL
ncbi:MAG TPA: hypothetical protein VK081_06740, partial [Planctomycetota bacterium]|nr:hypothetical protein [Planctomycetota bacterium]